MVADELLPKAFLDGLQLLRAKHYALACVAAVDANFALIDVGEGATPDGFVEPVVRVFARMPLDINNAVPYGVVTIPVLHRKDGAALAHQHVSHANALLVATHGGGSYAFWSWDWKNIARRGADAVALAHEWAWKCLQDGAR